MIERAQYDIALDSKRFSDLYYHGVDDEVITENVIYVEQQLQTDLGERLDKAESHYVYEIKEGRLFGDGSKEPFADVIDRGIIQRWDQSRENAELAGFLFIESFMTDANTADGAIVFNPSPGDGENYQKNYLDVYKKVGSEVHCVRYFSDLTNTEYREKILQINPNYANVIPENPKDTDFLLNPVVLPNHLNFIPDDLADFVLGGKKGMSEAEFQLIWSDPKLIFLKLSIINTLVENPQALSELHEKQKAFYAAAKKVKDGAYEPTFSLPKMEIQYLATQTDTLGGGGCGSGGCSVDGKLSSSSSSNTALEDKYGSMEFSCPSCGEKNTRSYNQLIKNCQHCGSDKVLPKSVRIS